MKGQTTVWAAPPEPRFSTSSGEKFCRRREKATILQSGNQYSGFADHRRRSSTLARRLLTMSAVDYFLQLPAVTRTLVASSVVMSVSVYTGLLPYGWIIFHPSFFGFSLQKFPPQIWRLVTSFLLTAPKLGMIMDPFFLYQYGSALETESSRFSKKSDFVTYVAFVQLVILVSTSTG